MSFEICDYLCFVRIVSDIKLHYLVTDFSVDRAIKIQGIFRDAWLNPHCALSHHPPVRIRLLWPWMSSSWSWIWHQCWPLQPKVWPTFPPEILWAPIIFGSLEQPSRFPKYKFFTISLVFSFSVSFLRTLNIEIVLSRNFFVIVIS